MDLTAKSQRPQRDAKWEIFEFMLPFWPMGERPGNGLPHRSPPKANPFPSQKPRSPAPRPFATLAPRRFKMGRDAPATACHETRQPLLKALPVPRSLGSQTLFQSFRRLYENYQRLSENHRRLYGNFRRLYEYFRRLCENFRRLYENFRKAPPPSRNRAGKAPDKRAKREGKPPSGGHLTRKFRG